MLGPWFSFSDSSADTSDSELSKLLKLSVVDSSLLAESDDSVKREVLAFEASSLKLLAPTTSELVGLAMPSISLGGWSNHEPLSIAASSFFLLSSKQSLSFFFFLAGFLTNFCPRRLLFFQRIHVTFYVESHSKITTGNGIVEATKREISQLSQCKQNMQICVIRVPRWSLPQKPQGVPHS